MIDRFIPPNEKRGFVHKRLIGAVGGFLTGGVGGAVSGFVNKGRRFGPRVPQVAEVTTMPFRNPRTFPVRPASGARAFFERAIAGGRTGLEVSIPAGATGCPSGFHPNKSDYYTAAGFVEAGSKCVRNRRRNLSNGRANTRSLRRMAAWDKQERKLGATMKKIARGR